jgi:hypothetical protein
MPLCWPVDYQVSSYLGVRVKRNACIVFILFKIEDWCSYVIISRKDTNLQNLGAAETKLLYTLHWIILDAAEECADADYEKGIYHASPFYYLFSIPAISVSAL